MISDKILQEQAEQVPKKFKVDTILFTILDADIDSIVKLNYERKEIADMKRIVNENDALYNSMMFNFNRIAYDKSLLDNNNSDKLRIKYFIGGLEDDRNLVDCILIFCR